MSVTAQLQQRGQRHGAFGRCWVQRHGRMAHPGATVAHLGEVFAHGVRPWLIPVTGPGEIRERKGIIRQTIDECLLVVRDLFRGAVIAHIASSTLLVEVQR